MKASPTTRVPVETADRASQATVPEAVSLHAIDVHAHLAPTNAFQSLNRPDVASLVTNDGAVTSILVGGRQLRLPSALLDHEEHLVDMDHRGLTQRLVSLPPFLFLYELTRASAVAWAKAANDALIAASEATAGRLKAVGTLPMSYPDDAAEEVERLAETGVTLIEIATNVGGRGLHDPAFRPVFVAAERAGVGLLLHPNGIDGRYAEERWHLRNLVSNPFETTYAALQLAAGGVLDAYPDLRICLSHGGGALAYVAGRIDHGAATRNDVPLPPSQVWMSRFYYDSVLFSREALDFLVQSVGAKRICYGTDYPFDMSDPLSPAERFSHFKAEDRQRLSAGTARELLGQATALATTPLEDV